ncbi:MAG: ascorbate-dependent monooxygenase [Acidobacteria bacterium]|nr:ascorbate-dependent monooxygenase [Acidobacteriota bacterium]
MLWVRILATVLSLTAIQLSAQPTYKEVAPILESHCQSCHRPNDIAPFALLSYDDAATWAEDIKRVVNEKIMPPWKPVAGYGEFKDVNVLSDAEKQTLMSWVDAGAPLGDPAETTEPSTPTGEWRLGEPDMVVKMAEAYMPPRGQDDYRCFVVSNPFDRAMNVRAVDVLPGNRQIVHHVIMFLDTNGQSLKLDEAEDGPGYTCFGGPGFPITSLSFMLGGWAPGTVPKFLPDGVSVQIPRGGRLIMQVHYFPVGRTGEDVTKVGLYLSKGTNDRQLLYIPVVNDTFTIPPGNANYEDALTTLTPFDLKVYNIFPHMHLLGRKIKVDATVKQDDKSLIYIDDWDFKWQGFYDYKEPQTIPAGSRIKLSCVWDNSEGNPRNPNNPLKTIKWGEGTQDEMCVAFLGVVIDTNLRLPFRVLK